MVDDTTTTQHPPRNVAVDPIIGEHRTLKIGNWKRCSGAGPIRASPGFAPFLPGELHGER